MNLSERLDSFLTAESMAVIRLVKTEAERLDLPLYIVGGSVRDLLLGRATKDFDFTVEGDAGRLAESILRKYAGRVVFHTRFGTATWTLDETTFKRLQIPLLGSREFPPFLDLISARKETYPRPGALPTVKRSTIDDDLHRRDFTINAMALRLDGKYYGELHDPLGGQTDLERGLIRVLHDKSFIDDPTRMLRAVRYAGRYDFEIEPGTLGMIDEEARKVLSRLSGERLRHEFDLLFEERDPSRLFSRLLELGLLEPVHASLAGIDLPLPSLEPPASEYGDFAIPDILSFRQTLGWTALLMPISQAAVDEIAKRLDFPISLARSAQAASFLVSRMPFLENSKPSQWTFMLDELPALSVYAVYLVTEDRALRQYLVKWRNVRTGITGDDLNRRGLVPGPRYAEILNQLRAAWLDGEVKSEEEEKSLLEKIIQ
jgi:tRNA nucleotidyltransferase (CCA-adding enzyme)